MKVTQAYEIINAMREQFFGNEEVAPITNEQELVDIGTRFDNLDLMDKYVKSLVNHIGKVIFDTRVYSGQAPSVYMDGVEYGSIVEKIRCDVPVARKNKSWDLKANENYIDGNFYAPTVHAKFFNEMDTWEIPMSFGYKQVMQSFSNSGQLTAFFTMIENKIEMAITINNESLIMQTITNFMAATIHSSFEDTSALSAVSSVKAINLLAEAKNKGIVDGAMNFEGAIHNLDFLKYSAYRIGTVSDRLERASTRYNIGGTVKFTPKSLQKMVLLSDFARAADVYLQSDTFHNEFTKLPKADHVSFWQGSGEDFSLATVSDIHKNIKDPLDPSSNVEVAVSGILGCIFDREALGVTNMDRRVRTRDVGEAEFYSNFYKVDARYFNDYDENFVVFFAQ